jgi:hypothetical protein
MEADDDEIFTNSRDNTPMLFDVFMKVNIWIVILSSSGLQRRVVSSFRPTSRKHVLNPQASNEHERNTFLRDVGISDKIHRVLTQNTSIQ